MPREEVMSAALSLNAEAMKEEARDGKVALQLMKCD